jgi:hypothetical protein
MNKIMASRKDPDMLDEYDFSNGVRGKYAQQYREGTNIVRLDDDVAAMFPSSEKVNEALRSLGEFIRHHANIGLTKGESGRESTSAV